LFDRCNQGRYGKCFTCCSRYHGTNTVCVGSTTQYSNSTSGGVWSSSNTAVATVNASGLVTGVSAGTATIIYTVTN
ncbi:Ig-like domain-containing protein, partial [Pedobacter agri]|uniref:Ig-like domain-containing protein n=1 Tax=Pedobacter agri TaxID=454586 RepID=UPI00187261B1